MKHATPLWLETDTIDYLDYLSKNLSRQRKCDVSRSEAVEYVVKRHWIKMQKRMASQQTEKPKLVRV